MSLGSRIQALRKDNHYTQAELADLLGVKPTTVASWEQDRNKPLMDKMEKLADAFGITISQIAGDEGKKLQESALTHPLSVEEALAGITVYKGKAVSERDRKILKGIVEGYLDNREQRRKNSNEDE